MMPTKARTPNFFPRDCTFSQLTSTTQLWGGRYQHPLAVTTHYIDVHIHRLDMPHTYTHYAYHIPYTYAKHCYTYHTCIHTMYTPHIYPTPVYTCICMPCAHTTTHVYTPAHIPRAYTSCVHMTHPCYMYVYTSHTHTQIYMSCTPHTCRLTHTCTHRAFSGTIIPFFKVFFFKLFIWLHWVLVTAHRILWDLSLRSMDSLVAACGLSSCYTRAPEHADSVFGTRAQSPCSMWDLSCLTND